MKYAVVTGSTKGIGCSIGMDLLNKGYYVFFNYSIDDEVAKELEDELNIKYKKKFTIIKQRLSSYEESKVFVEKCLEKTNKIDCLILNAGITDKTEFRNIKPEVFETVMNTNLNVPFYLTQGFGDYINENGRIIFISSVLGEYPHATAISYGVSKAGLIFLAKSLVKEFCDRNITVNAIAPGFADTLWQKDKPIELRRKIEDKIALKRFAKPEEISRLCMSIIENEYINGECIHINGGYSYR